MKSSDGPGVLSKVIAVSGDVMAPQLGLSKADQELVVENVSVIFHMAAIIKFDAPLR